MSIIIPMFVLNLFYNNMKKGTKTGDILVWMLVVAIIYYIMSAYVIPYYDNYILQNKIESSHSQIKSEHLKN